MSADATPSRLQFTRSGGIARITLAAPSKRNAIDPSWCRDFAAAADACMQDKSVRVILLDAQGDYFSVGGDIADFVAHKADLKAHVLKMATSFHEGLLKLHRAPPPVVAAVSGMAAGGGFSLALSADMILASRSARFISAYTASGLSPDGGLSYFLPRAVGVRRAFEITALNPTLSADRAYDLGIVGRVYDDADFAAEVEKCVGVLAAMPPAAMAALKRLLAASPSYHLEQQLDAEARQISTLAGSPETLAMLETFFDRRRRG